MEMILNVSNLSELKQFISETTKDLENALSFLNWSIEGLQNTSNYIMCKHDSNHFIPSQNLFSHYDKCKWSSKNAYLKEFSNTIDSYIISNMNLLLDYDTVKRLIGDFSHKLGCDQGILDRYPIAGDKAISLFSAEQRLILYKYVLSRVEEQSVPSKMEGFGLTDNASETHNSSQTEEKSHLELLAEQRDQKRRRISYRSKKSVYTNRKTATEILRELINNHMEVLFGSMQTNNISERKYSDFHKENVNRITSLTTTELNSANSGCSNISHHASKKKKHHNEHSRKHKHSKHKSYKHIHKECKCDDFHSRTNISSRCKTSDKRLHNPSDHSKLHKSYKKTT